MCYKGIIQTKIQSFHNVYETMISNKHSKRHGFSSVKQRNLWFLKYLQITSESKYGTHGNPHPPVKSLMEEVSLVC